MTKAVEHREHGQCGSMQQALHHAEGVAKGARTEGRAFSVASRMDSSLLRGSTRWSYSIMHERTPGLVSTIPGTACSHITSQPITFLPPCHSNLNNPLFPQGMPPARWREELHRRFRVGASGARKAADCKLLMRTHTRYHTRLSREAGGKVPHLVGQVPFQLVHPYSQIEVQLHWTVLHEHIPASKNSTSVSCRCPACLTNWM